MRGVLVGEVLGQAGVAEACTYTLEGASKNQKSKIATNSSNSTAPCLSVFSPLSGYLDICSLN